jgi:hypothetical protein
VSTEATTRKIRQMRWIGVGFLLREYARRVTPEVNAILGWLAVIGAGV